MPKMTDQEVISILEGEISTAIGMYGGDLAQQRAEAMKRYLGEPYGNEVEGRSQVVSNDVMEAVESILPDLVEIFVGAAKKPMEFEPHDINDVEQSEQETERVFHVFYKENKGFMVLYSMFKDALLQKVGFVKHVWEESKEYAIEEYDGLDEIELTALTADDDVEVMEHEESIDDETGAPKYHVKIKRVTKDGHVLVREVPPEEMLISSRATHRMEEVPFIAHRTYMTRTDLINTGFDKSVVDRLPSTQSIVGTTEQIARNTTQDENLFSVGADPSMELVEVYDCYAYIDYDGDGVAEKRRIVKAGNEILLNEEYSGQPFSAITPIPQTHKFFGQSLHDVVKDIALIKTQLQRQLLDNMYLTNNPRIIVNQAANMDDVLNTRSGAPIRVRGHVPPGSAVSPLMIQPLGSTPFNALEYMETVKENRTGNPRTNQGLDADSLNKTATGIIKLQARAQRRLELIARIFAETGVKDMFLNIHRLLLENDTKETIIKIRGKYVPVNPAEWRERTNMTVNVGIGTGNKDQMLQRISVLVQMMMQFFGSSRLVGEENMYNALKKYIELSDLNPSEKYLTAPEGEPPPPPPDPQIELEKARLELEQMKIQGDLQLKKEKQDTELALKQEEIQAKLEIERSKAIADANIKALKGGGNG